MATGDDDAAVLLSVTEGFPASDCLGAFCEDLSIGGLPVRCEQRESTPFASLLLLVPTAVVVLFTKSFFEAIAKKAGEDAYPVLKGALFRLVKGVTTVPLRIVGKGSSSKNEFSLGLSFYAELKDERTVKFLLGEDVTDEVHDASIDEMCRLLSAHFGSNEDDELSRLCVGQRRNRPTLLAYDGVNQCWKVHQLLLPNGSPFP